MDDIHRARQKRWAEPVPVVAAEAVVMPAGSASYAFDQVLFGVIGLRLQSGYLCRNLFFVC